MLCQLTQRNFSESKNVACKIMIFQTLFKLFADFALLQPNLEIYSILKCLVSVNSEGLRTEMKIKQDSIDKPAAVV